jgi:hypothetical protein
MSLTEDSWAVDKIWSHGHPGQVAPSDSGVAVEFPTALYEGNAALPCDRVVTEVKNVWESENPLLHCSAISR